MGHFTIDYRGKLISEGLERTPANAVACDVWYDLGPMEEKCPCMMFNNEGPLPERRAAVMHTRAKAT